MKHELQAWYLYFVPDASYMDFLATVKIATITLLTVIPPLDWLPCEENHSGYLYLMRLDMCEEGASQDPCFKILGSNKEHLQSDKLTITTPSYSYTEVDKLSVSDCARKFRNKVDELTKICSGSTIVEGEICYFLPHQYWN